MRDELDKALCAEFPGIFRDRNAPMTETCMCWGFECGDGWHGLVRAACLYMENALRNARSSAAYEHKAKNGLDYLQDLPPAVVEELGAMSITMGQVKEKFGTLRLYWHSDALPQAWYDRVTGAVEMAEFLSSKTCEKCGLPGELRGPGWVATECDTCSNGKATMREYEAWREETVRGGAEPTAQAWHDRKAAP